MPASFSLALGLILAPRWTSWNDISRSRISMGAIASRRGYVLIETFAISGGAPGDDVAMSSLAELAERCSVHTLLVAEDVPMSYVLPFKGADSLAIDVVPCALRASN